MGNTVPVLSKDLDEFVFDTTDGWLHVATCSMQGWRSENEDEHLAEKLSGVDDHFFIGVFDGHGGKAASAFTRKHMVNSLIEREEWKLYCNNPQADGAMALLGDALKSSFIDVDNLLIDFKEKRDQSGTTACCCVVTPTFIVCANAGDSRAVLETGQGVRNLSEDHKPGSFRERERIEAAGGMVYNGRVDRELGVARAIGDFKYKRVDDLPPSKQRVTCVPDVTLHVRASGDSLLVIACDGVWDVLSSSAALGVAKSAELALQVACETAGNEQHESRNPGKGEGVVGGSKSKSQVWDTEGPDAMIRPSRALSSRSLRTHNPVESCGNNSTLFVEEKRHSSAQTLAGSPGTCTVPGSKGENRSRLTAIVGELVDTAFELGSQDNITAVLVDLRHDPI